MRDTKPKRQDRAAARPSALTGPMYEPLDFVFVRAPLLPVESYLALSDEAGDDRASGNSRTNIPWAAGELALRDPHVLRALAVGSQALVNAVERSGRSKLTPRDAARLEAKLLRYLIRMSTRPTPFGLFAGVALGQWGDSTKLSIEATAARTRTRIDMAWLLAFVFDLEAKPEVRQHLRFVANSAAVIQGDRVVLATTAPSGASAPTTEVSLRATGVVRRALALARQPIAYEELAARLIEMTPSATQEKADKLLTELWQHTLLLTDLRPPLTTQDPARYVVERLAGIPEAVEARNELVAILDAASEWDCLPAQESIPAYRQLVERANAVNKASEDMPYQVDMALQLRDAQLSRAVGIEAARAAELLLRMTPLPQGLPYIESYRQAFITRYGPEREVPLLELLDSNTGLGQPKMQGHHHGGGIPAAKANQRSQVLDELAFSALRDRQQVVELDEKLLSGLETWTPSFDTAPISLDICAFVAARSQADIDAGEFMVVIGPNLGAQAAGRNLGRFADLLAPEGTASLERAARAEEVHAPGHIWAELVYLPPRFRSANVVIRPALRSHEIVVAASPGVAQDSVIPLDELVIGVRGGRFYVRWPSANREIVVSAGHMLNSMNAPDHCRFLADVSHDGRAFLSSFDWGPAESFPYRPRVQSGRVVLRPAEWRADRGNLPPDAPASFREALARWRERWDVPRHVLLSMADNRLVLDLDDPRQAEELRAEIEDLKDGRHVLLQEVLPSLDQIWMPGPGGHFVTEFVVSMVLRADRLTTLKTKSTPLAAEEDTRAANNGRVDNLAVPATIRLRPPGSDWLFAKLYASRTLEEDLIANPLRDFAEQACASGLAEEWFFIRYSDPDPHIRLRFRGQPDRLTKELLPSLCTWAGGLMAEGRCLRFAFDTYDREVERYGGPAGTDVAESIFAADSRAVSILLNLLLERELQIDRTTLAILSVDDLLSSLGLTETERLRWYKDQNPAWDEVGQAYRERKTLLRALLSDPQRLLAEPGGADVALVFATRRAALAPLAARLGKLAEAGELTQKPATLFSSYVHLHFNRLLGSDPASERSVLGLLLRTREGLERTPGRS
ncbi:MAG TPA: lantibiotic dehydratase [Chloroflexia bacterium]|nr:lantibiotic dehydratase [Chloroflexia bacterium]